MVMHMQRKTRRKPGTAGFTLIELLIVISIIVVIISIALPAYERSIVHTRETALREDLFNLRQAISRYTEENQQAPESLADLTSKGYLKTLPRDPFTNSNETWSAVSASQSTESLTGDETPGIVDVRSGSKMIGSDGKAYSQW